MATQVREFTYSMVFTNIHPKVVEATKELIKSGIWNKDMRKEDKALYMGLWVQKVAKIYGFSEVPKFYFVDDKNEYRRTGGGCYFPSFNEIYVFHKPSLVTLLHEFRHAMQFQLNVKKFRDDEEEDARAWSLSLFRKAAPKSYKRAVEKGILHFT